MRYLRVLCLSFLTFAASAGLVSARAADPPASAADDAAGARADELAHKGNELALKLRWKDAESLFQQAWALKRSYDIGGNLGIAELKLGKFRDAAEHLSYALKTFPANGKGPHRELIQESLAKAKAQVAMVTIEVDQKGALVLVDGIEIGRAPLGDDVFVEARSHVIEAKLAEFNDAKETIEGAKGSAQAVRLSLSKVAVAPAASGSARAGAAGSVGAPVGPAKPALSSSAKKGILIAGSVLGAGGLAAGIGLTVAANSKGTEAMQLGAHFTDYSACAGQPTSSVARTCGSIRSAVAKENTLSNAAVASFVTGGALALGTAIFGLWASRSKVAPRLQAGPLVGARDSGVVVIGSW